MAREQKSNTGVLFVNDHKTGDSHPDWKGTINFDGRILDIAGWANDGTNGQYISLRLSAPRIRQPRVSPKPTPAPTPTPEPLDDECPF